MTTTSQLGTDTIPSREEYELALAMLQGTRSADDFDENFTDEDRATAAEWVAQYEAEQDRIALDHAHVVLGDYDALLRGEYTEIEWSAADVARARALVIAHAKVAI